MIGNRLDRRNLLRTAAASGAFAGLPQPPTDTSSAPRIDRENQRQGTTDWQLTRVRINRGAYRTSLIEGYCSHQSISAGQTLQVHVSTDPASAYRLEIFRMGYYGGLGGRKVAEFGPLAGTPQPTPEIGPRRIRQCRWEPSLEFSIPDDWVSGVYLGKLTTEPQGDQPYWQSYIIFIVRDQRQADILFQCSDNTWQAYNRWPENESLYTHPGGAHFPGVAVSFDRPYGKYCQIFDHPLSVGSGEFLLWEFPLCYWLEQHGYDVTYCSNSDILSPEAVTRARAFISVGHDEYWDLRQYRAVETAIERGTNILWLSGNSVYMVSPLESARDGRPARTLSRAGCYGELRRDESEAYQAIFGPLQSAGPDERRIIGARTIVPFNGAGDWVCSQPDHWVFEETAMRSGDAIAGLVGWEFHGDPDTQRPGLQVLAEGTAWSGGERPGRWAATIFPGGPRNFVFNASTIWWAQGLASPPGHILPWSHFSRPHGPDRRVQQITRNLLARALSPI